MNDKPCQICAGTMRSDYTLGEDDDKVYWYKFCVTCGDSTGVYLIQTQEQFQAFMPKALLTNRGVLL